MKITSAEIWVGGLRDRAGSAAVLLGRLADARVNLQFVLARRMPEKPGLGVIYVSPITPRQARAARNAGLRPSKSLAALKVEGADRPGAGYAITAAIAAAGISLRGFSAQAIGKRFTAWIAFDGKQDAARAARALKKI